MSKKGKKLKIIVIRVKKNEVCSRKMGFIIEILDLVKTIHCIRKMFGKGRSSRGRYNMCFALRSRSSAGHRKKRFV